MQHSIYHGNINPTFADRRQGFIVLAQAAIFTQPSKSALHNPLLGQHNKGVQVATPHNFRAHAQQVATPIQQRRTVVATIKQHFHPAREQRHALQQVSRPIAVRPIGGMHHHAHQPPLTIHHNMPFVSFHFLTAVVAAGPLFQWF